ncbi:hypothetical protein [Salinisphaera sp. G21_0]|uniref:hypothetical protein n=1 Tax=Salinisphaera sp. G21_0 TaxID=2821094 RepID=UPI001ADBD7E4|nr:hypothetical protein [Salinisphaera sp. G21_0]MBO9484569.1 hypothetical protein [Salinisphaera sp. G21_0]
MLNNIKIKSLALALLSTLALISTSFASEPIFHGQSPETESFAAKLGIERQVYYPSESHLFAYYAHVEAESMIKVDSAEAKQVHHQINQLIAGFTPREPDAIHLHLDHQHKDNGRFDELYDVLQAKAEELGLTVSLRENSNASPSQYPPIQRTSVLEIMLGKPETMNTLINYAADTYQQYLATEKLNPADSCLFVHPQYTPDENNPAEQYLFHYQGDIMLSNPVNCAVSHNYAINLLNRLLNMQGR